MISISSNSICSHLSSRLRACISLLAVVHPQVIFAHAGHQHAPLVPAEDTAHWFLEPDHAIAWVVAAGGLVLWAQIKRKQSKATNALSLRPDHD